jgi:hypothetical protein
LSFEKHWFIPDSAYEYLYYAVQPNTITKKIPDLVNILHAFWRIQLVKKFNKLDFPKWMEQQGKRWPFYAFFRRIPTIHRLQRDLFSTFAEIQNKALTGAIHESDFLDELNNLDKLIEAHFKANENEFFDEQLSFESLRPEIPNSTSIDHTINKRSPAPIFPVIAAATFGSIAGVGIATLANTGSYLYNAQSNSPDVTTLETFRQHAKQLTNIQINQNQITNAINNVNKKLTYFKSQIVGKFEGTAILILEEDLRSFIIQLQSVIQITILKYNAAMSAAADLRTSPYVLPQSDLDNIADVMIKTKNFRISRDLSTVKTYTHIENQQITFIFDIPIIDDKKEFLLYTIAFLPSFKASVTLIPQLDSNHIAINSQGDKYTVLNELEISKCLSTPPRCTSHVPVIPIRDESSCVALTYITDQPQCPYMGNNEPPRPTFLFYDVTMFYSVPTPTSISGQCLKSTLSNGYKNGVLSINGTGKVTLTPTCTISLPDGSTHTTPSRPLNQSQLLTDVFTNLQNLPQRTDFLIQDNQQLLFQPQPPITMAPTEEPTFHETFIKNLEPHNSLSTVAIVIICFVTFACVFMSIYCFCPRFFLSCLCTERINQIIRRTDSIPDRQTYTVSDTPLDGALNAEGSYWFTEPDDPNEASIRSYVRPKTHESIIQLRDETKQTTPSTS